VHEADAVPVDRAEEHDEAGQLEQRLPLGLRARAEVQRRRVLEDEQERHLALLDELLAVGLAQPGGDVPVDVADVVAELVAHDLVEFDAAAAERRAVLAAQDVLDRVAHPPLELAQELASGLRGLAVRIGLQAIKAGGTGVVADDLGDDGVGGDFLRPRPRR
jgi:hypothetical protein